MEILAGILLLLLLLLWLSVGVELSYRQEKLTVWIILLGGLKLCIYPMEPKAKKKPAKPDQPPGQQPTKKPKPKPEKEDFPLDWELVKTVISLMETAVRASRRFLKTVVLRRLELAVAVGGEDAAEAAQNTARWAGAFGSGYALAGHLITLRPAKVAFSPNYLEDAVYLDLHLALTTRPVWVLRLGFSILWVALGKFLSLKMQGKTSAETSSTSSTQSGGAGEPAAATE